MSDVEAPRTIRCDFPGCGEVVQEKNYGDGWPGWSSLHGINLNGNHKPQFCESCTAKIMEFIDPDDIPKVG